MDRGVRKAGAAADKDKRRLLVCNITEQCETMRKKKKIIFVAREKREGYQPRASMPGGLPRMGLSPGVELVPGVGASLRGVGVLDLRPGVEDLSFCRGNERASKFTIRETRHCAD